MVALVLNNIFVQQTIVLKGLLVIGLATAISYLK
jgi:hypothetical protein